jgi:hypothetical protein
MAWQNHTKKTTIELKISYLCIESVILSYGGDVEASNFGVSQNASHQLSRRVDSSQKLP